MRFRLGFCIGFGTGYYLGSMAGRERFEQINRTLKRVSRSETFESATDKAREAVDAGVEKARGLVDSARGNGDEPETTDPYLQSSPPLG